MTDYILKITSWNGVVPGAIHFMGRIEGPRPRSCHGGTVFRGRTGTTTCDEGHPVAARGTEWDVLREWSPEDYERWRCKDYEGDGPSRFRSKAEVLRVAAARFTGEIPDLPHEDVHLPEAVRPGDKLWYGWVSREADRDHTDAGDGWGLCIAVRTPDWYRLGQVADFLGVSRGTVIWWANHGYIESSRRGRPHAVRLPDGRVVRSGGNRWFSREEVMRIKREHVPGQRWAR